MKRELAHHLDKAGATVAEVERIVESHKCPDDPRTVLARGLLATIVQHHRSVLLLIKSGSLVQHTLWRETASEAHATACGLTPAQKAHEEDDLY